MRAKTIRKALRFGIFALLLFPALALAFVNNQGQLSPQSSQSSAMAVSGGTPQEEMISQLIVKPRQRDGDQLNTELHAHNASRLAKTAKVGMSVIRPMSGNAHVIRLNTPVTLSEARIIAARLMGDNSVEVAEPDHRKRAAFTPTDPSYATNQWNLFTPSAQNLGSANLPNAWSITKGNNSVTVAIIDTGYRPHADLGTVVLPGYDFISDTPTANDGNGRDSDAMDPGDWITGLENTTIGGSFYKCGTLDSRNRPVNSLTQSSWHGTHVAGIIAAQMNSIGIAGIAPNIQILPVRVLGKCGGYDSDIIDGMRWAAGLNVTGVPANPNPARVLNMSLGGTGGTACSAAYQSAVTEIINAGKVIVAAAGNDGSTIVSSPANCTGVIAVTANTIDGDNAYYATIGSETTISAPGGGCGGMNYPNSCTNNVGIYSLLNSGATIPIASPGGDIYVSYDGTSMATPHVSAVAALMFSLNPSLTPAQIKSYLQSSARPFPTNTICTTNGVGQCGAGLLDAYQALLLAFPASTPPAVKLGSILPVVAPGDTVTLSGNAVAGTARTIISYAWTQLSGTPLTLTNANSASTTFTAPPTGTYSFELSATDNSAQTGSATVVVHVNSPPVLNTVPTQTITPGQALNFTVTATDPDPGDTLIFHSVSLPPGATLSATGAFSWPVSTPAGNYILTYYASDNYSNTQQSIVNILVGTFTPTDLKAGWNLLGNGMEIPITVSNVFYDPQTISSLWKWQPTGNTTGINYPAWAFYSPSFNDGGKLYAASKGYDFLTTINAGEGFWVNAVTGFSTPLPVGSVVQSNSFLPSTGIHGLSKGWNLIAIGDSQTPAAFNASLSVTSPSGSALPINVSTLWTWDSTRSAWYFWAPDLVNNGSLASYITSKGYLDFSTLPTGTLSPTTGFWVNKP